MRLSDVFKEGRIEKGREDRKGEKHRGREGGRQEEINDKRLFC